MKTLIVVIGTIVILVLLVSSGVLGGAICLEQRRLPARPRTAASRSTTARR